MYLNWILGLKRGMGMEYQSRFIDINIEIKYDNLEYCKWLSTFGALPQKSFDIEIVAMFLGCLKRHLVEVERW